MIATLTRDIEKRCHEIGLELFEHAHAAEPKFWQRAWWDMRMMEYSSSTPRLQTELFRFMEALPHMLNDADIASHLKQYLDPKKVDLNLPLRFATLYNNPNSLFARTVGACVRGASFSMATNFITGSNTREAIENAERLRHKKMAFTLDVLGEATISDAQADHAAEIYMELIESLGKAAKTWPHIPQIDEARDGPTPAANVSIKLSALDPVFNPIDPERVYRTVGARLRPLLSRARELGVFVNVDMEAYRYRDLTLDFFKRLLMEPDYRDWPDIGIVVQAYLQDAEGDLTGLLEWIDKRGTEIAIRLVKGAYWDTETTHAVRNNTRIPVWTRKWESDACYEKLTRVMLENAHRLRPAFASHNVRTIAYVMATAEQLGLQTRHFELQMLSGMGDPLKTAIVEMGQFLRIYCPYGNLLKGMAYLIRRLLENTSNDSFLKQGFGDRAAYDRLLADPAAVRPPSAPLPKRHYEDTFEEDPMPGFTNAVNTSFGSAANRERIAATIEKIRGHKTAVIPLLIDGQNAETGKWIESTNPAHPKEIVGKVASADVAHADRAVAAATKALPAWSGRSAYERAEILRRAGRLLNERRDELTAWLVLEIGKNPPQADAEVTEAVDYCNYHAALVEQLANKPRRRNVPGEDNVLIYDPCGVCVLISPWDFPLAMLAGMVSAALGAGNTVIIKPSSKAPVVAAKLVEIFREAQVPGGVLNYLPGPGAEVGQHLVEHPNVHLAAFCGSRSVALKTASAAAQIRPGQRHIKRAIIDAGAKNAIIVDHDVDVDEAVIGTLDSAFGFSGQKCTACSRVIVLEGIYDAFCAKLADAAKVMVIGDPTDPATVIGPVINDATRRRVNEYITAGKKSSKVLFEASANNLPADGHFIAPIIFADVNPKLPLAQEEIFGPVLCVLRAKDFDQALELANDSVYALTGGLYSRSPSHIERTRMEFRVGNLYINRRITGSQVDVQPYGGGKLSGDGARLGGPEYLLQYCRPRTISENTIRHGLTGVEQETEAGKHHVAH